VTDNQTAPRPFSGLRVVDFSTLIAGPYGTRYLADLGAEVIKIETPEGDYLRTQAPLRDGHSTYFGQLNCGKKSVALNLKDPDTIAELKKLIATADVLVENFRPGVMARFGLDFETLAALNPRLIYCSVSGFGQGGLGAGRPAYAQTIHATSGLELVNLRYQDELTRPANSCLFYADVLSAVYAFSAINAALYHREKTGKGQFIDVSLLESTMNLMPYDVQEAQFPAPISRPVYKPVRSSDGFVILMPNTQRNFVQMVQAMGHPEWAEDERFCDVMARYNNYPALLAQLETWTMQHTSVECEEILTAASVPCARYRTIAEALEDPLFAERGAFQTVSDPAGEYLVTNLPFKMSQAETAAVPTVSEVGEYKLSDFL
jgi:crotonobetainyl-CoA:carnitine CoA-transferase CaiB-like acyl-CoA transferase